MGQRFGGVLLCVVIALGMAGPLAAEVVVDPLTVPRNAAGQTYAEEMRQRQIDTQATYALSVTGDLSDGYKAKIPEAQRKTNDFQRPAMSSTTGLILVFGGMAALLIGFFLFGGGGMLLSRDPSDKAAKPAADGWKTVLGADGRLPNDILAQIATMSDRREAMVQLLRYCLQYAASKTDVRFARSDTEREALRRLPRGWVRLNALKQLLRDTELAHYGGRAVDEDSFQAALTTAAEILERSAPRLAGRHA